MAQAQKKKHSITIKLGVPPAPKVVHDRPLQAAPSEEKKEKQSSSFKKIEENFEHTAREYHGIPIEDIILQLNEKKRGLKKARFDLAKYYQTQEEIKQELLQMLRLEYYTNRAIADPVLKKYEVHFDHADYQQHLDHAEYLVKALHWIQRCHRPERKEISEQIERLIAEIKRERFDNKKLKNQCVVYEKEVHELKQNIRIVESQLKEALANQSESKAAAEDACEAVTESTDEAMDEAMSERTNETMELAQPLPYQTELEEIEAQIQEPNYVTFLKQKKYEVEPAAEKAFDLYVRKPGENKKIPLCYIDYEIENSDEFDNIMKETNSIYLLFDNKKTMKKGNTSFTSWLIRQKKRRSEVQFSFTTLDQLKDIDLEHLDNL